MNEYGSGYSGANTPASASTTNLSVKPVWPFVLMAVLAIPVASVLGLVARTLLDGANPVGVVLGWVAFVVVVVGSVIAIRRSIANKPIRAAQRAAANSGPIGRTTDGQPIYPVVGYTSDGSPVTADRAIGVQTQTQGTNGLAIASLVLAFVLAPVGLILGFIARSQIAKNGQQGNGLALAGIIIGASFTVINIVAIIAMMGNL